MQLKPPMPQFDTAEKMGMQRKVGRAEIDNIASWKVREKCGKAYTGEEESEGYPQKPTRSGIRPSDKWAA